MKAPRRTAPVSFLPLRGFRLYYLTAIIFVFRLSLQVFASQNEYASQYTLECDARSCTMKQLCVSPPLEYTFYKYTPTDEAMYKEHPIYGTYRSGFVLPIDRFVSLDVTYLPPLDFLDVEDRLVGVLAHTHVSTPSILERIEQGFVEEVGDLVDSYYVVNTTRVNELEPGMTFGSKYDAYLMSEIDSFILNCETEESKPLAQVEWVKWFGIVVDKEAQANTVFDDIEKKYQDSVAIAKKATRRPSVVAGFSFKNDSGSYFSLPGGNSYVANLIRDANADYLGDNSDTSGSYVVPLDVFLRIAANVKYWIHADYLSAEYMDNILNQQKELESLPSVQCQYVVPRDKGRYSDGYIPFFETGTSQPSLVLQDLIHILHPELLDAGFESRFYRRAQFHPATEYKYQCPYPPDDTGDNTGSKSEKSDDWSGAEIAALVIAVLSVAAMGGYAAYRRGLSDGQYKAMQLLPSSRSGQADYSGFDSNL